MTSVTTSRTLVSSLPPTSSISSARRRRISSTTASGSAKLLEPQRRKSAGEIVGVEEPQNEFGAAPGVLEFRFRRSQIQIGTYSSRPTPRPASSVFIAAVEKPGWKSISRSSRSVRLSGRFPQRDQATIYSGLLDAQVIDATAIVLDLDVNVVAAMVSAQSDAAKFRLADFAALFRQFDAVRRIRVTSRWKLLDVVVTNLSLPER